VGCPLSEKNEKIQSMADLLRSGATLTSLSCPACSSPLFRLKNGDLWCAQCQKKVIVVREGQEFDEAQRLTALTALSSLERTLLDKVMEINEKIQSTNDLDDLQKLSMLLSSLLENLKSLRSLGKRRR